MLPKELKEQFDKIFKPKKKGKKVAKWRLVPDEKGTYTLEKWHSDIGMYLCKTVRVTPEQADKQIENMEGKTLYYREET